MKRVKMTRREKWAFFLYKRLAGIATCRFGKEDQQIWMFDKYQVASFGDVFLDPNYWRAFTIFDEDPALVIDCGAHCGHFAILADMCFRARFGESTTQYILIEPNKALHPAMCRNLQSAKLLDRVTILAGLVGRKEGAAALTTDRRNFLVSHIGDESGVGQRIEYLDLAQLAAGRSIDLLKLDIEGAEFEFVAANPDVLALVRNAVVEVHNQAGTFEDFSRMVEQSGLFQLGPVITGRDNVMAWFEQRVA
jgi:FkbM family methyltransferase